MGGGGEEEGIYLAQKNIPPPPPPPQTMYTSSIKVKILCAEWIQKKGGFDTVGLIKSIQTKEDDPGMVPTMKRNDTLEVYLVCVEILSLKKYCLIEQLLPRFHTGTN